MFFDKVMPVFARYQWLRDTARWREPIRDCYLFTSLMPRIFMTSSTDGPFFKLWTHCLFEIDSKHGGVWAYQSGNISLCSHTKLPLLVTIEMCSKVVGYCPWTFQIQLFCSQLFLVLLQSSWLLLQDRPHTMKFSHKSCQHVSSSCHLWPWTEWSMFNNNMLHFSHLRKPELSNHR